MISSERDSRGVTLLGVDPDGELALGFDLESIDEGRFLEGPDDSGLVVGRRLLERLETGLGKRVVIMTQDPDNNVADRGFRIVGVFSATLATREEQFVYAGKSTLQSLLGVEGQVSEVAINGGDYRHAGELSARLQPLAGGSLETLPWQRVDAYLGAMLPMMDGFVFIWIVVVFLALSFGLVNTLMMAVFERVREFGLMQALGMKPHSIRILVLAESVCLLALGLLAGNLLAWVSLAPLQDGIDISAVAEGMETFGAASTLYPAVKPRDVVIANIVVLALGILTSLVPAWRASMYQPVEAITKT
jgi:ABC-type lipoprotein release transport system permease subunit